MSEVERFNYIGDDAEMVAEPDGEFVRYSDYEQLESENDALRDQLAEAQQRQKSDIQLIRDRAARYGDEEGLSQVLEALAAELENDREPSNQAKEVQCADCFAWFNSNSNHTCRRQVRRNRRRQNAATLTQLEGERG